MKYLFYYTVKNMATIGISEVISYTFNLER
jgi:hypothetical protein